MDVCDDVAILGATSSTYTLTKEDIGKTVACRVQDSGVANPRESFILSDGVGVGKRTLTVTADNQRIRVGAALPAFTLTYEGFVNGDTAEHVFDAVPTASCAADGKEEGVFPITVSAAQLTADAAEVYELWCNRRHVHRPRGFRRYRCVLYHHGNSGCGRNHQYRQICFGS